MIANEEDEKKINALIDLSPKDSRDVYQLYGYTKRALTDCDEDVRRIAYDLFGWPEESKNDSSSYNREMAYRILGINKNDINVETEEDYDIIKLYYSKFGYDDVALSKRNSGILFNYMYKNNITESDLISKGIDTKSYPYYLYFDTKIEYDTAYEILTSDNSSGAVFNLNKKERIISNAVKVKMYDTVMGNKTK